jgi:hypothetical protein
MNRFIMLYIISVFFSMVIMGCEKDGDCKEVITVPHMYLEDFGGTDDCGLDFTLAAADSNYLINQEEYYQELMDCQDSLIDFTKYVLLAGSKQFDTTVVKTNQAAIRNCKDHTFTYRISFEVTDTVDTRFHQYHAIVPKIPDDYQVGFEIVVWRNY